MAYILPVSGSIHGDCEPGIPGEIEVHPRGTRHHMPTEIQHAGEDIRLDIYASIIISS